ncbi:MAG: hypothetical protein ACKN9T_04830 [Candidatus Methylumidiphilus sp.]
MENTIIQEFGLPVGFPDEDVPAAVIEFCFDTANQPLDYAVELATRRGFRPLCRRVPCDEPGVMGLGLDVEGRFVPLLVKLRQEGAAA